MNRIYKVIWSKIKHQYVVVSEIAHSNGKQSRTARKSLRSRIAALVVCGAIAAFGVYGTLPTNVAFAATGAETTAGQYIAIKVDNSNNSYTTGGWRPQTKYYQEGDTRTFNDANGQSHNYTYVKVNGQNYWVRQGYTITIKEEGRYTAYDQNGQVIAPDNKYIIDSTKSDTADSEGLITSSQVVVSDNEHRKTNSGELQDANAGMYGGAVNTGGTTVPSSYNYYIDDNGKGWKDVGAKSNISQMTNFKEVYQQNDGTFNTKQNGSGTSVSKDNIYVIDGTIGAFFNSNNTVYTENVYGHNNEVLMTGYDETTGKYYSYWGTKINDPNMPISSMTMGQHEQIVNTLQSNIDHVNGDIIDKIELTSAQDDGKGGTLNFKRRNYWDGEKYVDTTQPGDSITISSVGGTNGADTGVKFDNGSSSFTVNTGSKVVGTVGEGAAAEGATLDGISINGKKYKLGGGKTYEVAGGTNIASVDESEGTDGQTVYTVNAKGTDVEGDSNITVTKGQPDENNVTTYDVKLNPNLTVTSVNAGGTTISNAGLTIGEKTYVSSAGLNAGEQKITNVSAGTADTDAVNVSQLNGVQTEAQKHNTVKEGDHITVTQGTNAAGGIEYTVAAKDLADTSLTNITNDGKTVIKKYAKDVEQHIAPAEYKASDNGTVTMTYVDGNGNPIENQTATITGLASDSELADAAAKATTEVVGGKNATVTPDTTAEDGHTKYTVDAYDTQITGDSNVSVDGGELDENNVRNYSVKLANTVTIGDITKATNNPVKIDGTTGKITGLTNTTWDENYQITSGQAATEDQLKSAVNNINENSYKGWTVTTNGGKTDEDKAKVKSNGTVDFSNTDGNVVIDQDGTNLTIDLADNITLGEGSSQIKLNGNPNAGTPAISVGGDKFQVLQNGDVVAHNIIATKGGDVITKDEQGNELYSMNDIGNRVRGIDRTRNDDGKTFKTSIEDILTVDKETNKVTIGVDGADNNITFDAKEHKVYGLSNTDWSEDYVITSGQAATEDQLRKAMNIVESSAAASDRYLVNGTDGKGYTVNKDTGIVTLKVKNGEKYDDVTISDVASKTDVDNKIGDLNYHDGDGSSHYVQGETSVTEAISALDATIFDGWKATDGTNTFTVNPNSNEVQFNGDKNITVGVDEDTHSINVSLKDDIILGDTENSNVYISGNAGMISVTGTGEGSSTISIDGNKGTINGLTNKTWDAQNYVSGQAATEDQLAQAISDVKTSTTLTDKSLVDGAGKGGDPNKTYGEVTENGDVNLRVEDSNGAGYDVTIKDVASATDLSKVKTDLGDVSEIHDNLKNEYGSHTSVVDAVNNLDNKVDSLDIRVEGIEQTAGQHSSVSNEDGNITIAKAEEPNSNGGVDYKVGLNNDKITLGNDTSNVVIEGTKGNISATGNISAGSFTSGNVTINKDVVSGLSNTNWDWNTYNEGGYSASSNAATEAQLHGAMQGTVQYDRDDKGNINKGSITLGDGENGTVIHNVASGQEATDAANVGQLAEVANTSYNAINNMGNQINHLNDRISKVGAGAAALAALHPLDFDPDDKLSFAAGYGNYAGENAVAVGAFYQPNEDTMFSIGGTFGNDENMVNAGVSFKFGQKSNVSRSRVSMAKELVSLRDEVAQLKTLMANAGVLPSNAQLDTSDIFPDVPENHWAYEYVRELAKLGIIEGYPDGNFAGDRMMTRYEMAAIVYRAMQKGVNIDSRMVNEFAPELKLIRVDVVAKDKNGNPTIERVRVNENNQQA